MVEVAARRANVMTGRKMLALAAKHDGTHAVVIDRALEHIIERIGHLPVLRIVELRAIHHHPCNAIFDPIVDGRIGFILDVCAFGRHDAGHDACS